MSDQIWREDGMRQLGTAWVLAHVVPEKYDTSPYDGRFARQVVSCPGE